MGVALREFGSGVATEYKGGVAALADGSAAVSVRPYFPRFKSLRMMSKGSGPVVQSGAVGRGGGGCLGGSGVHGGLGNR